MVKRLNPFKLPGIKALNRNKRPAIKWGKGPSAPANKYEVKASTAPKPVVKTVAKPALHYAHVEDLIILNGNKGCSAAVEVLLATHKALIGENSGEIITEKLDGSPSLVFGYLPENGRFFVSTKSFFSKSPKILYTSEDVQQHYGYSPDLCFRLNEALVHLPKACPKGRIFQGDLLYVRESNLQELVDGYAFTANTLTYTVHKAHPLYARVRDAALGIAVFARHVGELSTALVTHYDIDIAVFSSQPDVLVIYPSIVLEKAYYPAETQRFFLQTMDAITAALLTDLQYESLRPHARSLMGYVNQTVRKDVFLTAHGFQKPLPNLDSLFALHRLLQQAKGILNKALSFTRLFETSVKGKSTKGEGFVVLHKGLPYKIVDRHEFSRFNFLRQQEAKGLLTTVIALARMNPPTYGHEAVIKLVLQAATQHNARHVILLRSTFDKLNNPLKPQAKLAHLQRLFPEVNFELMDPEIPNFLHYITRFYRNGTEHLIFVAGDDRINTYEEALFLYNGNVEFFDFKRLTFLCSGSREHSISGNIMRQRAKNGEYESFCTGLPSMTQPAHARALFDEIKEVLVHT